MFRSLAPDVRQYLLITANYWAFTLTDGALRMLVVLYFYQLGYSPLQIALLFVFYELFGVITNLLGGWLGARWGLNRTMNIGLGLQLIALLMLTVPTDWLSVLWVMSAQAVSGIAKDLNKMSAKSAIKLLLPEDAVGALYRWVAFLTGSKNALKGLGFFFGAGLLAAVGFRSAIVIMLGMLLCVWVLSLWLLKRDLGRATSKPGFVGLFSKSREINLLAAARLFLFASRDVWFVVALPVYLASTLLWNHWQVGGFLAFWIIGYGAVQTVAPYVTARIPFGNSASLWAVILTAIPATIAINVSEHDISATALITGLLVYGLVFALNSSLHSFLIVRFANRDAVSLDVGFYYMANASGRLLGTLLSGWVYQAYGLAACLWASSAMLLAAVLFSLALPRES